MPPLASMIIATSANGIIGSGGEKPWHNPLDDERLERFTRLRPVVVGRRTFRAMPRIAPKRWYLIPSETPAFLSEGSHRDYEGYGYFFCRSFDAAFDSARALAEMHRCAEFFVIGGASMFRQAAERVDRVYLTRLHDPVEGDERMPALDLTGWQSVLEEPFDRNDATIPRHDFRILQRPRG